MLEIVRTAVKHKEAPPPISDLALLGAQLNYLDDLWNAVSQPLERSAGAAGGMVAGGPATRAPAAVK
jgi:hypothetical protein